METIIGTKPLQTSDVTNEFPSTNYNSLRGHVYLLMFVYVFHSHENRILKNTSSLMLKDPMSVY